MLSALLWVFGLDLPLPLMMGCTIALLSNNTVQCVLRTLKMLQIQGSGDQKGQVHCGPGWALWETITYYLPQMFRWKEEDGGEREP